jgi:hypothetical protein
MSVTILHLSLLLLTKTKQKFENQSEKKILET